MSNSYYASTAYNSKQIPAQPPQVAPPKSFSFLDRATSIRLPWGNTKDIAPAGFVNLNPPQHVRAREEYWRQNPEPDPEDFHLCIDHERYRYASFSFRTLFWGYMAGCGKAFFLIFLPVTAIVFLVAQSYLKPGDSAWELTKDFFFSFGLYTTGVPLLCWILGSFVLHFFPDWVSKPAAGPKWELNRRTGMVTLFQYQRRFPWSKAVRVGERTAPFYEFDAYIDAIPDRQGLPFYYLLLVHRYQDLKVDIDLLGGVRNSEECMALWDMWQNFMDISQPLPDIPLWEEYRHLDPTTAEHDRRTGRPPRYWRDMDDKTYKTKLSELRKQVSSINTRSRYNLMNQFVDYCY